jgi:hypothetical protein
VIFEGPEPQLAYEPGWVPELIYRLEHADNSISGIGAMACSRYGKMIETATLHEFNPWNTHDGTRNLSLSELSNNGNVLAFSIDTQAFGTTTSSLGVVLLDTTDGNIIHNF